MSRPAPPQPPLPATPVHAAAGPVCRAWLRICLPFSLALALALTIACQRNGTAVYLHLLTSLMAIALNLVTGLAVLHHVLRRRSR